MIPKTKIQKAVHELAKTLPRLTQSQINNACNIFFEKLCYSTKNTAFCLECGHDIDVATINKKRVVCGNCGSKLKVIETRKRTHSSQSYLLAVASLVKNENYDFQVVRVFEFIQHYKKGQKSYLYCVELCQNWYNIDDKRVINSRLIGMNGWYQGDIEIRGATSWYKNYNPIPHIYCSTSKFRAEYRKKGINSKMKDLTLSTAIKKVEYSQIETLLKAGMYDLVTDWEESEIIRYWDSLKICLRNKYKITDVKLYKDLLEALSYLNKDLRNSYYVCPKNLHKAHDFYIDERHKVQVGREIAANLKKAQERNPAYIKEKQKFFDLEISNKKLKIVPLRSVPEFLAEGEKLNHCVFKSNYYSKPDSLILSARIDGTPIETIEVSLKDFKVLQCYGMRNTPSEHHDTILKLLNTNMHKIKQITV
ncbi:PcfJ domain-containing protein [Elizabethkingia anophelis]|nr:PcfJ domain-containing protein [Elizabethkingia anophelis]MCT3993066.1 PcfJ domain-containing protein [Elizabethkingia anophelis]MCT3997123.1 PcfJ domain-containing protein [Elizabethkingia anophelis]